VQNRQENNSYRQDNSNKEIDFVWRLADRNNFPDSDSCRRPLGKFRPVRFTNFLSVSGDQQENAPRKQFYDQFIRQENILVPSGIAICMTLDSSQEYNSTKHNLGFPLQNELFSKYTFNQMTHYIFQYTCS
jgi:hypothetical protein